MYYKSFIGVLFLFPLCVDAQVHEISQVVYEKLKEKSPEKVTQSEYESLVSLLHEHKMTVAGWIKDNACNKKLNATRNQWIQEVFSDEQERDEFLACLAGYKQAQQFSLGSLKIENNAQLSQDLISSMSQLCSKLGLFNCVIDVSKKSKKGECDGRICYIIELNDSFFQSTEEEKKMHLFRSIFEFANLFVLEKFYIDNLLNERQGEARQYKSSAIYMQYCNNKEEFLGQIAAVVGSAEDIQSIKNNPSIFSAKGNNLHMIQHIEKLKIIEQKALQIKKKKNMTIKLKG